MTDIGMGTQGASRATWRGSQARQLLHDIVSASKKAGEIKWRAEFRSSIQNHPEELDAVIDYWLDNNLKALLRVMGLLPIPKAPELETADARDERIKEKAKRILFDLLMPNGKLLGDCTGADCKQLGGAFFKLSKRVPPKRKVADVLTPEQVKEILGV